MGSRGAFMDVDSSAREIPLLHIPYEVPNTVISLFHVYHLRL